MKRRSILLIAAFGILSLVGCATAGGAAIGAGIGSMSGNTKTGALIGGGVGLIIDSMD